MHYNGYPTKLIGNLRVRIATGKRYNALRRRVKRIQRLNNLKDSIQWDNQQRLRAHKEGRIWWYENYR